MAAEVRITVSQQGSGNAAKDAAKDVKNLGEAAKDAGGGFSAMKEIAIGALREIGALGVGFAIDGLKSLGGAVMEGISDAKEAAKINAQTEAVIKSMGNAAGVSAEHVQDYAASLSAAAGQSLFGDSQIQESSNLLLTFDKIKGETLDVATALTVDLAQALGGEPKDQAMMLGKALNDPIKGITALGRAGLTFSQDQKDVIQALVETGDVAGAQKIILAELEKQVGGSAAAAAAADGGWAQFNDRLGEAKETIGAAILPLLNTLVGFLNDSIMPAIEGAAQTFSDFASEVVTAWETAGEFTSSFFEQLGAAIDQLIGEGSTFQNIGIVIADTFNMLSQSFEEGGLAGLLNNIVYSLTGIQFVGFLVVDTVNNIISAFQSAGPISQEFATAIGQISPILGGLISFAAQILPTLSALVQQVLGDVVRYFQENGAQMLAEASATWNSIQQTVQSIIGPLAALVNAILAQIAAFWKAHGDEIMATVGTVWSQINKIVQTAMQILQKIIGPALQAIASFINDHGAEIQSIFGAVWNAIKAIITGALALISGILEAALKLMEGDFQGAWDAIQQAQEAAGQALVTIVGAFLQIIETIFSEAWGKVKSDAEGAWNTIKGGIESLASGIVSTLKAIPGQISSVGADIINGIINGVNAAAGQLYSTLQGIARDALQAAKDALGISSPSKVFALKVGKPIAEGMAVGLMGGAPLVAGAGAYAAQAALAGASSTYNQQRSMSLTQNYYGVPAAPAMDTATAMSLAGV